MKRHSIAIVGMFAFGTVIAAAPTAQAIAPVTVNLAGLNVVGNQASGVEGSAALPQSHIIQVCSDTGVNLKADWSVSDTLTMPNGATRNAKFLVGASRMGAPSGLASHSEAWTATPFGATSSVSTSPTLFLPTSRLVGQVYIVHSTVNFWDGAASGEPDSSWSMTEYLVSTCGNPACLSDYASGLPSVPWLVGLMDCITGKSISTEEVLATADLAIGAADDLMQRCTNQAGQEEVFLLRDPVAGDLYSLQLWQSVGNLNWWSTVRLTWHVDLPFSQEGVSGQFRNSAWPLYDGDFASDAGIKGACGIIIGKTTGSEQNYAVKVWFGGVDITHTSFTSSSETYEVHAEVGGEFKISLLDSGESLNFKMGTSDSHTFSSGNEISWHSVVKIFEQDYPGPYWPPA